MSTKKIVGIELVTDRTAGPDRPYSVLFTYVDGTTKKKAYKTLAKALSVFESQLELMDNKKGEES